MTNLSYKFIEFKRVFLKETDYSKLSELIQPLLTNWKYKNKNGNEWWAIKKKCFKMLKKFQSIYFPSGLQEKDFSNADKEMLLLLFRFMQRILFFSKSDFDFENPTSLLSFALSFDTEISIQAFKVIALTGNTKYYFKDDANDELMFIFIKMMNVKDLIIEDYNISSQYEIGNYEQLTNFYNQSKSKIDLFLSCLKKDVFYTIKRVYAFLLFKGKIKKECMNKIRIKKFCDEIFGELKSYLKEEENEIYDEVKFCTDRLILFLEKFNSERSDILKYLEVESEQDFMKKILNYKKHTKFEEILSLRIFENFLDHEDKDQIELVSNKGNPDFDYTYMSIAYNYIKSDKSCIENHLVDIYEYRAIIENMEKYVQGEDLNVLKILFKTINVIYMSQQILLEPFESSTYLSKINSLIDPSKPNLSSCCITTICHFMTIDPHSISRIVNHTNLLRILDPKYWRIELFGTFCKLFEALSKNQAILKKIINGKKLKEFLNFIFSSNFEHYEVFDESDECDFRSMLEIPDEYLITACNFYFSYLFNRAKIISENQISQNVNQITQDVNFFALFFDDNHLDEQFEEYFYENTEFTLETFDKIVNNGLPTNDNWTYSFARLFSEDIHFFDIPEIPIFYFMKKMENLLPLIENQNVEELKKTLKILEGYLFIICNAISNLDYDGQEEKYLKIYNLALNFAMNLLPSLFRFRYAFTVKSDPIDDIKIINENHLKITFEFSSLLGIIWDELIYILTTALDWDNIVGGQMTKQFLDQIYIQETKGIHKSTQNLEYYSLIYNNMDELSEHPNKFHQNLVQWTPRIKIIELYGLNRIQYLQFAVEFAKKCLSTKDYNCVKSFHEWISINQLFKEEFILWKPEEICITYEEMREVDLDNITNDLDMENVLVSLIFPKPGLEKRNLNIINRILNRNNNLSQKIQIKLNDFYIKYFDPKEIVNYAGVFKNIEFINKLLAVKNFKSFINNEILDVSLYYINNVFIDSVDYIRMYIFVLETLTFSEIKTDIKRLEGINLDQKKRNKFPIYTEMNINLKTIPKYLKNVLKSKKIPKRDKIRFCIAILKYLSNNRTILEIKVYTRILNFAIKSINKKNKLRTDILIKYLIHQLLEDSYDIMKKKNLFDGHLGTYKNYLNYYEVLGFTNLNGLKAKWEKKLLNLDYYTEDPYSRYRIVLERLQEHIFKKLLKLGTKNLNALNCATEILINNTKYSKFINDNEITKILKKHILCENLTDKIPDTSDFEVSLKFIISCLKSESEILQNNSIDSIIKVLKDCPNDKIYNIAIVLFRSLDFVDVVTHENDAYVTSKKFNELSGKYISQGLISLIIEKLTVCKKEDLIISRQLENFVDKKAGNDIVDMHVNWNNYDSKLGYVYTFISTVYKNYFRDSVFPSYDNRSELWPYGENFVSKTHDLSRKFTPDGSDNVDRYDSIYEYRKTDFIEKSNKDQMENVFRKIYMSYVLYDYEFRKLGFEKSLELMNKIEKIFSNYYNIKDLKDKIKIHEKIDLRSWEHDEFINLSGLSEKKDKQIEETATVDISIGIVNGTYPCIEWEDLNEMSEFELEDFVEGFNNCRTLEEDEYYGIDIDFLRKCNNLQRSIFVREEEILKTRYTIFGKPKYWPLFKESESYTSKQNYDHITNDIPDKSAKECNTMDNYELMKFLKSRFKKLTSTESETHPFYDYLMKLYSFSRLPDFIYCEDRIAKTHALKMTKKAVDYPRKKEELGIEKEVITNYLNALSENTFLCNSDIWTFLEIVSKHIDIEKILSLTIMKNLFLACRKEELDFDEILNSLQLLCQLREQCMERIEKNIYFVRLLFVLSRFPKLSKFTLPIFETLNLKKNFMSSVPLFDNSLKFNPILTNIPEDEIPKKLLWNFKEMLKTDLSATSIDFFIEFASDQLIPYLLDLISMCLQDNEVLDKEMLTFSKICQIYFIYQQTKYVNEIKIMEKTYDLNSNLIFEMNFPCLLSKGVFTKNQSNSRITAVIYDRLYEITQNNNYSPRKFINFLEIYEGFINLLSILTTFKKKERIEQYAILRQNLENEMTKEQDLYNELFQKDENCAQFLVRFNFITFSNKRKYLRNQIQEFLDYDYDEGIEIFVNRDFVVKDSYDCIMEVELEDLKSSRIRVNFVDEDGYDEGGLTKEWLELLAKGVTNQDLGLFTYSSDKHTTLLPYSGSNIEKDHLQYFKFIGRVIGKAIFEGYNFPINLDKTVYKFILNKKCDLQDLNFGDPQFYKSLVWMRDNSIKDILHLTFTYENTLLGELKVEDLKLDGRNIQVTDENKNEYIDLIIQKKFINNIYSQLKALKDGILEIIDEKLINIFDEKELELLICGVPEINIEDWKRNTIYYDYNKNSKVIIWFWEAVYEFNTHERAKLMHFCTGSSRVPYGGFNDGIQKFKIQKITGKRLPTAHTCFNQLDLPEYETYEELRRNIIYAINEGHGTYGFA